MRKVLVLTIVFLIVVAVFWFGSRPPSDETVMAIYQEHHDAMTQLAKLYQEDQVGMAVRKNGSILPTDAADRLSAERLDRYKALVKEIGVTRSLGGSAEGYMTLQIFNLIPLTPIKTLEYSPMPPTLVTSENTDDYVFSAEQYRRVCRPIEDAWYVCLDYED